MPAAVAAFGESGIAFSNGGKLRRTTFLAWRALRAAWSTPGYLRRLQHAIRAANPNVVHSNGLKCHLLAGYATPRHVPVVWHIRDFLTTRPVLGRWLRRLAKAPALAVANSHAVAEDTRMALPGVPVETLYNGIDTDSFFPGAGDGAALDHLAGLSPADDSTIRVGLAATYSRWKGQEVLIDAAALLVKRLPEKRFRFYIIGGPVYSTAGSQYSAEELQQRIRAANLASSFGLIPFQRELTPVYRALDILTHTSTKPEPFGRTIVEGMACGLAVIVARAGGAVELFTEGQDAVGAEPGNPSLLADAIERLAGNAAMRRYLGENARITAVERFSRGRMGERMIALYESVRGEN